MITKNKQVPLTKGIIASAIIAGLLLLIANSALWVNNTLFNTEKFTEVTKTALLSESSRTAVAGEVIDQALAEKPIVKRVAGATAVKLVAGLLDTNLAESATDLVVSKLQTTLTTKQSENIEIDLTGIKSVAAQLIDVADVEKPNAKEDVLPDKLVILDKSDAPNFYQYGVAFLWIAPLAGIGALILLAYPHIKSKKYDSRLFVLQGSAIIAFGFLALMIGPLFRPTALADVSNQGARVVIENVYNAFFAAFNAQTNWMFIVGGLFILVPASIYFYNTFLSKKLKK
jgi:hypothetical protein